MDFTFTAEQDLIRKTVWEFCQKKINPRVVDIERQGQIPQTIIQGLADLGLLEMSVSQEYGSAHADPATVGLVVEEIARNDMSCAVPTFFLVQAAWGHVLDKYGAREAKETILPHITPGNAFL